MEQRTDSMDEEDPNLHDLLRITQALPPPLDSSGAHGSVVLNVRIFRTSRYQYLSTLILTSIHIHPGPPGLCFGATSLPTFAGRRWRHKR